MTRSREGRQVAVLTCAGGGCQEPATVRARAADGVRFYCRACADIVRHAVTSPTLFDEHQVKHAGDTEDVDARAKPHSLNPFVVYRETFQANHGAARLIQALVLHLYNDAEFPVHLGTLLGSVDEDHWRIVIAILAWYHVHGGAEPVFIETARRLLATQRRQAEHIE